MHKHIASLLILITANMSALTAFTQNDSLPAKPGSGVGMGTTYFLAGGGGLLIILIAIIARRRRMRKGAK